MLKQTQDDVSEYHFIVKQIHELIDEYENVNRGFIADAVLKRFNRSDEWFLNMQEHHKQSITDRIQGKHE